MSFHVPNIFRLKTGRYGTPDSCGNNGYFFVPNRIDKGSAPFKIVASDGLDWDHVSISLPSRCPTWVEMCFVKSLFWDDEDCVMQLHPPKSEWINNMNFCLHLWRPQNRFIPIPPGFMVGIKELGVLS